MDNSLTAVKIGLVSTSDRASLGIYKDEGIPALKKWLESAIKNPIDFVESLIPDEQEQIESILCHMADVDQCHLIFTTGGTGPTLRDVTPDATLAVVNKEMPGFGEQMRQISLYYVPTAILSRQTAGIRGESLIINLPGRPKAISETLGGVKTPAGAVEVQGLFSAVPYCVELISGVVIETNENICQSFRPKKK